ncbi:tripartite tricarboxylate transporter TctB family protein [Aurantimonas sp. A2-1-M11]|uniref:tripartite tricarboxylate transporter TctB family protein n=1 Tax=Aurantimonas sp. A2-1-M11 TaxID=3113712 RepID=UPI002F921AF0
MMTRPFNPAIGFALFVLTLNTVYASQIWHLGVPFQRAGEPGPSFLPILLCACLFVVMGRILFAESRTVAPAADRKRSGTIAFLPLTGPVLVLALTALFIFAFERIGYLASAAGYTFLIALFFNHEQDGGWLRPILHSALTSGAITLFGWLFFAQLFDLYLPVWGG